MSEMSRIAGPPVAVVDVPTARPASVRSRTHAFYLAVTFVLIALVVRGFWPTYFGPLLSGAGVARHWIVHLHGAVFSGWMLLLLAQVLLVATGRVRLHRRVGSFGIVYGYLVLVMGLVVSFVAPVLHVRAGEWTLDAAAGFMLFPLVDMLLFGGFFVAAVYHRKRPELHKRLILAATVALAFAGVARIFNQPTMMLVVLWLSPLAAAMGLDVLTRGRVHPVNALSTAILLAAFARVFVMESAAWLTVGRALLVPFI